jgi:riboflavin synthase
VFTGIVEAVGRITAAHVRSGGLRLVVDANDLSLIDVAVGDSVALNGCCLTVVAVTGATLAFDVSAETVGCTTGLDRTGDVNLETAVRVGDRLGGHMMSGHVDGVGSVTRFEPARDDAASVLLEIEAPQAIAPLIATKGSIAVNGVSLTVNRVAGSRFATNLIPHTLAVTTLKHLTVGARVNLEVDVLARYVARLHQAQTEDGNHGSDHT